MRKYKIVFNEDAITNMSKDAFKMKVKKAVVNQAFEDLKQENGGKSRTRHINYKKFETSEH